MAERVVVTGIGIISALGTGMQAHVTALRNKQSGVKPISLLKTRYANDFVLGEIRMTSDELSAYAGLPVGDNGHTRTALLSLAAMKDLLEHVDIELLRAEPFAFINANTVGGMSKMEDIYMDVLRPDTKQENIKYIDTLDCAESTERVVNFYNLKPFTATISTACSSSSNSFILGARMIKQGIVKRAVVGGGDALSRFTLNGFYSLKNVDKNLCKPFDQNRLGLNLGEGAGFCLLELESDAKARGANIIAVLSGYANTNDAYHPTAPSPTGEGAYRTMQEALAMAGLETKDISYINAHGTATQNNDAAEGLAIQKLFGTNPPPFSSTKPFTGHTLAAAGVIEGIFSMLALQEQMIIPNMNFETRMEELAIQPATELVENAGLQHVLSNSFGFGGSNVSLIFSKP
ncbi:MAG: Beta-ketoacyl synthase [Flavipsychrobacter sp.]|jgi:3-oxoacyl-[acyl-carrier-protein] synthase-1|nr:Beta-ketoacyl synthase [Flavipsychrobacter sp.]